MFDVERFIEDCKSAVAVDDSHKEVREIVAEAVSDPGAVMAALGEPDQAGFTPPYQSDELTILNFAWAPLMTLMPHNHAMWAVIGIYSDREDNIFWRRDGDTIEAAGAKALTTGDAAPLGPDVIHSVTNPIEKITAALHVLWRRLLCPRPQRMGPRIPGRAAVRCGTGAGAFRSGERALCLMA